MTRAQVSGLRRKACLSGAQTCWNYLWPVCLQLIQSPLLQVGMALLKFLQTKQIFPAALAMHTLLVTAMAQTGTVDHSYL